MIEARRPSGSRRVVRDATAAARALIDGRPHVVIAHEPGLDSRALGRATGYPAEQVAEGVLMRDEHGFRLLVIPGSRRLSVAKARRLLDSPTLRPATAAETRQALPTFASGALPPFGPLLDIPVVVDQHLLTYNRVLCCAGDLRHSLLLDTEDLVRFGRARVAQIAG